MPLPNKCCAWTTGGSKPNEGYAKTDFALRLPDAVFVALFVNRSRVFRALVTTMKNRRIEDIVVHLSVPTAHNCVSEVFRIWLAASYRKVNAGTALERISYADISVSCMKFSIVL